MQTASHQLHFRDERAPEEIKVELERKLMVLLHPLGENGQFVVHGGWLGPAHGCHRK